MWQTMKTILITICILLLFGGCQRELNNSYHLVPLVNDFVFPEKIEEILTSFILRDTTNRCVFEMWVYKECLESIIINLRAVNYYKEFIKDRKPLFFITRNNKMIFLYSGLEDIFAGDYRELDIDLDSNKTSSFFKIWTIIIKNNVIILDTTCNCVPFTPYMPNEIIKEEYIDTAQNK